MAFQPPPDSNSTPIREKPVPVRVRRPRPQGAVVIKEYELPGWLFASRASAEPTSPFEYSFSNDSYLQSDLDDNALRLKMALQYHMALSSGQASCPSDLSCINTKLPQDVIGAIFELYVHGMDDITLSKTSDLKHSYRRVRTHPTASTTPMTLTHVCSLWRALAVSTPTLWSKLAVSHPFTVDLPLIELWLSRSSSCLVDVYVEQARMSMPRPEDALAREDNLSATLRVTSMILGVSPRIRKLSLALESANIDAALESAHQLSFGALENLDVAFITYGTQLFARHAARSPFLRNLAWGNSFSQYQAAEVHALLLDASPWSTLTSFTIGRDMTLSLAELWRYLPRMSSLQALNIECSFKDCDLSSLTAAQRLLFPVTFPHLSSLTLYISEDPSIVLFEAVSLPALKSLKVLGGMCSWNVENAFHGLSNLIQRSGCRILKFHYHELFQEIAIKGFETHGIRAALQHLQHLVICNRVDAKFCEWLTPETGDNCMFPALRTLELQYCQATKESLKKLAISRTGLRSFVVKHPVEGGHKFATAHVLQDGLFKRGL